jgi:hypothetical protein
MNDKLYPTRALQKGLGQDRCLRRQFPPRPRPRDVIKAPNPSAYFCLARGTRGALWQDEEPQEAPTMTPTPTDGTDVTVHSQQEHGDRALTQCDPSHSTTMIFIPLQQRG